MVELLDENKKVFDRQSSKGNQLKWERDDVWYKADYCGYEGLAEYVVSNLLRYSSLDTSEYVTYSLEEIKYKNTVYHGASSRNFLLQNWQLITLERLSKSVTNRSLYLDVWRIYGGEERLQYLVNEVERMTGLKEFGIYLNKLFTIDALFLNEDRHMHNIAVQIKPQTGYILCPIFDNGAALLSDTVMDYPIGTDMYENIANAKSKTISESFDEQLDASEKLYGQNISFHFNKKDVENIVDSAIIYTEETRQRVKNIIFEQMRKYEYLFSD